MDTPDILLLLTEELAIIDNLSGRLYLIVYADPAEPEAYFKAKRRLGELVDKLRYSVTCRRSSAARAPGRARVRQGRLPGRGAQAPRTTSPPAT
jgi:anthranilate synthase component 1